MAAATANLFRQTSVDKDSFQSLTVPFAMQRQQMQVA
jgi:hypothetical protein